MPEGIEIPSGKDLASRLGKPDNASGSGGQGGSGGKGGQGLSQDAASRAADAAREAAEREAQRRRAGQEGGSGDGGDDDGGGDDVTITDDEKSLVDEALTAEDLTDEQKEILEKHSKYAETRRDQLEKLDNPPEELVTQLEEAMEKDESEQSDDEKKLLDENKELVERLRDQNLSIMGQVVKEEGYLDKGDYDDSIDGLQQYLSDRDKVRDQKTLVGFLKSSPEMMALYQHLYINKKPLETFMERNSRPPVLETKLEPIKDGEGDEATKSKQQTYENVIRSVYSNTGTDPYIIDAAISKAQGDGKLYELAKKAQADFSKQHEAQLEAKEEKLQEQRKAQENAYAQEVQQAVDVVKKNDFGDGLRIPTADQREFIDYITKPIGIDQETGLPMTNADKRFSELPIGHKLYLDYLVWKGMKIPSFTQSSKTTRFLKGKEENRSRKRITGSSKDKGRFDYNHVNISDIALNRGFLQQ